jgi:hypothetical protein
VTEVEYVAPDNYRTSLKSMTNRKSTEAEMIIRGTDGYVRTTNEPWKKVSVNKKELESFRSNDETLLNNLEKTTDDAVVLSGKETLDGVSMYVCQHQFNGSPGLAARSRTTTWVGVQDGLPYKTELVAWTKYNGTEFTITTITTYRDFNAEIKIAPPL